MSQPIDIGIPEATRLEIADGLKLDLWPAFSGVGGNRRLTTYSPPACGLSPTIARGSG